MIAAEPAIVAEWEAPGACMLGIFNVCGRSGAVDLPLPDGDYPDLLSGETVEVRAGQTSIPTTAVVLRYQELVNGGQRSLEGKNIIDLKDLNGKALAREYIAAAMKDGSAWVDYYWYKPGHNTPARKQAFVRKVQHGQDTYIVGSGRACIWSSRPAAAG